MKVLKILFNIVRITFYVLIGIVFLFVVVSLIAGWKLYGVKTPSMEPDYPVGSLVAVEKTDYDSLKVNDVITYKSGVQVVTHRIVKLLPDTKSVITKGDRNNMDDPSVNNENIIGRVKFSVPLAGYIVLFMNTRFGRIMTIIFVLALIGGSIIYRMASREDDNPKDEPEDNPGNEPEADPQDETKENSSGNESSNNSL